MDSSKSEKKFSDGEIKDNGGNKGNEGFFPLLYTVYYNKEARIFLYLETLAILLIMLFVNRYFYEYMFTQNLWLLLMLPLAIYGLIWQLGLYYMLIGAFAVKLLKIIEPPKEGVFSLEGREFKFYCIRYWIAYYTIWILRAMPLPWVDMFAFRLFGVKVGKDVVLYDSWVDFEFVEIGDHVMLSLNAAVYSHCVYNDKFLVKKVVIEKNSIVGAEALVAPGTYFEEGAILGAAATTRIGQRLADYRIHVGTPASKEFPIQIIEEDLTEPNSEINDS